MLPVLNENITPFILSEGYGCHCQLVLSVGPFKERSENRYESVDNPQTLVGYLCQDPELKSDTIHKVLRESCL